MFLGETMVHMSIEVEVQYLIHEKNPSGHMSTNQDGMYVVIIGHFLHNPHRELTNILLRLSVLLVN